MEKKIRNFTIVLLCSVIYEDEGTDLINIVNSMFNEPKVSKRVDNHKIELKIEMEDAAGFDYSAYLHSKTDEIVKAYSNFRNKRFHLENVRLKEIVEKI